MCEGNRTAMRFTMYRISGACSSTICSFTAAGISWLPSLASRSIDSMALSSPCMTFVAPPRRPLAGWLPSRCVG
jgi:hypothetical protein